MQEYARVHFPAHFCICTCTLRVQMQECNSCTFDQVCRRVHACTCTSLNICAYALGTFGVSPVFTSVTTATDRVSLLRHGFQQLNANLRMFRGAITEGVEDHMVLNALTSPSPFLSVPGYWRPSEGSAYKTMIIRYLDSVIRRAWSSCPL